MIEVEQTSLIDGPKDRPGDCLRAAWASVLETDIENLPRWDGNNSWKIYWRNWKLFFRLQGYKIKSSNHLPPAKWKTPFDAFTAVGPSPRSEVCNHVTVWNWEDGFRWDPYPGANGLSGEPDYWEWLSPIDTDIRPVRFRRLASRINGEFRLPPKLIR